MTVSQLKKLLDKLPDEARVFGGYYAGVGKNGTETWSLFDFSVYFRENVNSCRSNLASWYSDSGPTLILTTENNIPATDDDLVYTLEEAIK